MVESTTARTRLAVSARGRLAERLRALRIQGFPGRPVTQRQIAQALGASAPLVSSWESPVGGAVPPVERLRAYALFFATQATIHGDPARLVDLSDLTDEEEARRAALLDELLDLRGGALGAQAQRVASFWHFPDGQPIRIISTVLASGGARSEYADRWHPNHIGALRYSDIDAVLEVYGQIRADNPDSDVICLGDDEVTSQTFSSHVVILGGGDEAPALAEPRLASGRTDPWTYYRRRLSLPVSVQLHEGGDEQYDREYVVAVDEYGAPDYDGTGRRTFRPRYMLAPDGTRRLGPTGRPLLEYDVALLARLPNEMNLSTTVTICSGVFSRGTYGAVRAFTDPVLTQKNRQRLHHLVDPGRFWMLMYVPMFQGMDGLQTLTPDLNRPMHVLTAHTVTSPPG